MKRVCLHVSGNRYPPLPAPHHTAAIWRELAKGFDEYHVLARSESMRFGSTRAGALHLHLVPSFGTRMWTFFFSSWLLPYYALRCKSTHLVAQCPVLGGLAAALCAKVLGLAFTVEVHGDHYFREVRHDWYGRLAYRIYRSLSGFAFRAADAVRALSRTMAAELAATYGDAVAGKIVVVPTRVDLTIFRFAKTDYTGRATFRLLTVGACTPRKNHLALIEDLHASGIAFQLTIVGSGPLEREYACAAKRLGITGQVKVLGEVSHAALAALAVEQDAYVHYSRSEALSRAILEAMAAGLPVIATDVGFVGDMIEHGRNGLLLRPPWPQDLARCVGELRRSCELRERLGRAARQTVVDRFESGKVFAAYRALLRDPRAASLQATTCAS